MPHVNVKELTEGDEVEGFYAVREAALHLTTSGKPYIRLTLGDASGAISGNMWDGSRELFATFQAGDIIKIQAMVETYKGATQIKVLRLRKADPEEADPGLFVPVTPADTKLLRGELDALIASIADPHYQALLRVFFDDPAMRQKFCRAPAAKENHHAYLGGLLEHTVALARYADVFAQNSPARLNRDLLLCGTLLHDIGKTEELSIGAVIDYTDKGKLLGHLIIGSIMVEERAKAIPDLPEIKKFLVQHLILSHHGKFEYGSPVLPAIPEAMALHHIDNLDAKTMAARRIIEEDENGGGWTQRSWMLETRLYKDVPPGHPVNPVYGWDAPVADAPGVPAANDSAVEKPGDKPKKAEKPAKQTPEASVGSLF